MTYLIGITGRARAGKDTAARILLDTHGYTAAAFADPLKQMASVFCAEPLPLFHDDATKEAVCPLHGKTRRQIMQLLGTECVKPFFGPDVWVRHMFQRMKSGQLGPRVVITDVRFNPEADAIADAGGHIIHIERTLAGLRGSAGAHASEAGIDPDKVDFSVVNDGSIADLAHELSKVMAHLESKR